jgi:uncharacterized membrane protein SirB2
VASYYFLIKSVHVWSVTLSIALFVLRGGLMLAESPWLRAGVLRYTPHVVDTVLLTSALMLTGIVHQYPFANGWLTAKVLGLVLYVVLGSIALRRGGTRRCARQHSRRAREPSPTSWRRRSITTGTPALVNRVVASGVAGRRARTAQGGPDRERGGRAHERDAIRASARLRPAYVFSYIDWQRMQRRAVGCASSRAVAISPCRRSRRCRTRRRGCAAAPLRSRAVRRRRARRRPGSGLLVRRDGVLAAVADPPDDVRGTRLVGSEVRSPRSPRRRKRSRSCRRSRIDGQSFGVEGAHAQRLAKRMPSMTGSGRGNGPQEHPPAPAAGAQPSAPPARSAAIRSAS